jgi:transposase-like protein
MNALIQEEVSQLAGERYRHQADREAFRWGQEEGHVVYGGQKVPVERPRVRSVKGHEIPLQRYAMFQSDGRMQQEVERHMIRRVSTRDYEGCVDAITEGYGVRKSSVSRHWKAATTKDLQEVMERPLGDLDLVAIMIDGIHFHDHLVIVALGFSGNGRKHVLGLWEGATENTGVCKALLADLVDRGLDPSRRYLIVVDGSKALSKAIHATFGADALIQRCQEHKKRNVLANLPREYHASVKRRLRAAWGMTDYAKARKALLQVVRYLEGLSASAAASLQEGLEETLTIHRLKLPEPLRFTFRTTNPIESVFSRGRDLCRNVKRWRNSNMAQRWAGAVLLQAEKKFRRIRGHHVMGALVSALAAGLNVSRKSA